MRDAFFRRPAESRSFGTIGWHPTRGGGMDGNQRSIFGLMSSGQLVVIILLTAAVATSACSSVSNSPKQLESHAESRNCEVEKVLLLVVEESGRRIPGVQVELLNSAGARLLGETGNLGEICVARSEFDASVEEHLLFCREGYFCGVFRVQKDVARFEERMIALARVVLRGVAAGSGRKS